MGGYLRKGSGFTKSVESVLSEYMSYRSFNIGNLF